MPTPIDRLHIEIETIARSPTSSMSLTSVSPEGRPHGATVWFAPTDELHLLTLSAPIRKHSRHIDRCNSLGIPALVACVMKEEGQEKSQPCHGVSLEGEARRLTDPDEIEQAVGRLLVYRTFKDWEIEKYLDPPEGGVPAHGVYEVRPTEWTVFDGRLDPMDPDRLVYLDWPPVE